MALTKAQKAAAKKAIGGLNVNQENPYVARDSYEVTTNPSYLEGNADTAYRDMFYEQFTQPGMFASPTARVTSPNEQGTNAILQGIQDTMQTLRSQQFIPSNQTQTLEAAQDVYYNPLDEFEELYSARGGEGAVDQFGRLPGDSSLLGANLGVLSSGQMYGDDPYKNTPISDPREIIAQGMPLTGEFPDYTPALSGQGFGIGEDSNKLLLGQNVQRMQVTTPGQYKDFEVQYNRNPNATPDIASLDSTFRAAEGAGQEYIDRLYNTSLNVLNKHGSSLNFGDPGQIAAMAPAINQYIADNPDATQEDILAEFRAQQGIPFGGKVSGSSINKYERAPAIDGGFTNPEGETVRLRSTSSTPTYTAGDLMATARALSDLESRLQGSPQDLLGSQYISYGETPEFQIPEGMFEYQAPQSYRTLGNALAGQRLAGILGTGAAKGLI